MNQPLVSIILPVFNRGKFIFNAIESILNQTYKNFELIVIDDASTDNTTSIIKNFTDSRIFLVKNKVNIGVAASTNKGIRKAKGKYIAKMDSDDISLPSRIEKQVYFMEANDRVIVCGGNIEYFGAKKKVIKYKENHKAILAEMLLTNPFANPTVIIRKSIFNSYMYDESLRYGEDYEFWTRIGWEGEFYNLQEVLLLYRIHPQQLSSCAENERLELDVNLQMALFHKINYSRKKFTDEFVKRMVFSTENITLHEVSHFFNWLNELLKINNKQQVFDQKGLAINLKKLRRTLVFDLFFTNKRKGLNNLFRKKIWIILPLSEKIFVLNKKINERIKYINK